MRCHGKGEVNAGSCLAQPECSRLHVEPFPAQGQHFVAVHSGIDRAPQRIPHYRVEHFRLDPGAPARQDLGGRRNRSPRFAVEASARVKPETDWVA